MFYKVFYKHWFTKRNTESNSRLKIRQSLIYLTCTAFSLYAMQIILSLRRDVMSIRN